MMWRSRAGERIRRVRKVTPRAPGFGEHGLGGDLLVGDQHVRVGAAGGLPVVAEGDDLAVLRWPWTGRRWRKRRLWVPLSWAKKVSTERERCERVGT